MSRERDKRAEHQGEIIPHPFFQTRQGCLTMLAIMAAAACAPWLIKIVFGL
jgi:hypothetical protein